jgi:hypothetical protein
MMTKQKFFRFLDHVTCDLDWNYCVVSIVIDGFGSPSFLQIDFCQWNDSVQKKVRVHYYTRYKTNKGTFRDAGIYDQWIEEWGKGNKKNG